MWLYVILIVLFLYAIIRERFSWGCNNILFGVPCNERKNILIVDNIPTEGTTTTKAKQNITRLAVAEGNRVYWRSAFIFGLFAVLFCVGIFVFMSASLEIKIFIAVFLVTGIIYFMLNFYNYHFNRIVADVIQENLALL
jgi:hypothetical protein